MARRRERGEGSIYFDARNNRYAAALSLGSRGDGTRARRTVVGKTKAEVRAKLREVRKAVDAGMPPPDGRLTVGKFLDNWLTTLPGTVEPSTLNGYAIVVRLHLKPAIGSRLLAKLSVTDVDALWAAKREAGLSPNYQRIIRATLRRALTRAERDGLVVRNVAALSTPPKLPRIEQEHLTVTRAKQLLAAVRGDRMEACYALMLSYGLRRGEALGLCWTDLDIEARTLAVRRAVKRETLQPGAEGGFPRKKTRLVLGELKTGTSRRTLTLTPPILELLRTRRARLAAERLAAGPLWHETGLIFPSATGTPYDPDNFAHAFRRACIRAGLGNVHPHQLRHSAASIMLAQGVSLHTIKDVLGHSSIRVTSDFYAHLEDRERRAAAEAVSSVLFQ